MTSEPRQGGHALRQEEGMTKMKKNNQNFLKGFIILLFVVFIIIAICFGIRGSGVNTKAALQTSSAKSSKASSVEDKLVTETITVDPIVGALSEQRQEIIVENKELIIRVVFAEAGNQPYVGKLLVAATIKNRSEQWGLSPTDVVTATGQYAAPYSSSTFTETQQKQYDDCKQAVEEVFNNYSTYDDVLYFCNPKISNSDSLKWMQTKQYVVTVADHTFYKEG